MKTLYDSKGNRLTVLYNAKGRLLPSRTHLETRVLRRKACRRLSK